MPPYTYDLDMLNFDEDAYLFQVKRNVPGGLEVTDEVTVVVDWTKPTLVSTMPEIHQWLNEQTCPAPSELPVAMRNLRIYGCTKVMWGDEPISIVCFLTGHGMKYPVLFEATGPGVS